MDCCVLPKLNCEQFQIWQKLLSETDVKIRRENPIFKFITLELTYRPSFSGSVRIVVTFGSIESVSTLEGL